MMGMAVEVQVDDSHTVSHINGFLAVEEIYEPEMGAYRGKSAQFCP